MPRLRTFTVRMATRSRSETVLIVSGSSLSGKSTVSELAQGRAGVLLLAETSFMEPLSPGHNAGDSSMSLLGV